MFSFIALTTALVVASAGVHAEKHSVRLVNKCGWGTPYLIAFGKVLLKGEGTYTASTNISSAISILDTGGQCYPDGIGCMAVETTLINARSNACPNHDKYPCISSSDLSLIPPHKFNVPTAFWYEHGCDGAGHGCYKDGCEWAFYKFDDNQVQVECTKDDVNLVIQYC